MKIFNLIKRLFMDSHEKQSPQRFGRYAAMLIMLLTLGVGQMWGASEGSNWYDASSAKVYFDNTNSSYSNVSILIGRQWNYGSDGVGSSGTNLTKVSGTNNLYYASVSFNKYTTFCFIDATNWGWEGNKVTARCTYASHYTNTPNDNLGSSTHLYVPASGSNNASVTHTTPSSYTSLNYTQTLNQTLSTDGGSTFSASTAAIATVKVQSKKLNGNSSTTDDSGTISSGSSSTSCAAARTATVTYSVASVATGYEFVGWYDGSTQKSTSTTYTYNALEAKTITARFKETQYSLTFSHNSHGSIAVNGNTVSSGSTANVNYFTTMTLVASPNTGYDFSGWTKSGSNTGSVTIGNAANASTTIKATNTGATVTAGFTPKTATVNFDQQSGSGGSSSVTATYDAAMPSATMPTRDHYTFGGYFTSTGGGGTKYYNADGSSARTWNKTTTTTLYAYWIEITHDVRANTSTHATTSPSSWTAFGEVTGGTVSATSIATGYRFNGWSSSSGTFADASSASTTFYPTTDNTWVTASIVAKTYSVTLDKNGGDSDGSVTATYNSSSLTSFSGAAYAGYSCDGYFTASDGGTKIINANGTLVSGTVAGWLSSGNWVKDAATITLYAHWTEDATYYTLNYGVGTTSDGHVTVSAAKTSDESAISTGASLVSGTGVTITATPATHYKFVGWYTTAACLSRVSTSNPYSFSMDANTNLYAKVELMTTTVTFNKNGGSGSTPATLTATHGSSSLSSGYVAPTRTGYTFNGWYDAESGGNKVFGTNGVITASSGYADGSSNWTYTGTTLTVYARWTAKSYTVTLDKQSGSGGPASVSATYNAAMPSATMPTRTGYDFNGYYGSTGGSGTKYYNADGSSAHIWDQAGARTIYAYWTLHNYTITYSPSSAPTGCTYTTKPTSADYNSTVDMVITPSTGYTVTVSAVDASSNVVTVTPGASNHYTFTQPASAVTVTVTATETMSSLSTSCHYDVGNPSYAAPSVSGSATNVGYVTTRTITATAAGTGYTFAGWTLTNCTRTDGGAATATSITIRSNGDGAAATVVANYNEVLTQSTWIVAGGNKIVTTGTTWRTTADANNSMIKKTGHSTESIVYFTVPVTTVCSGDNNGNFQFKIYNTSTSKWYGLAATGDSYYLLKAEDGTEKSLVEGNKNIELRAYVTGDYEFKLDYSTSTPKLTVTWPVFNQVRISAASPTDATNVGNFDMSDPVSNVRTVTRSLKANTTYTFKIMYNSDWYGYNSGTFTRSTSTSSNSRTISTSGGDMTLTTDYAGDYTFRFNQSTKALSVDFPEAYKVTYDKGTVDGSSSSCSAKDIDNGNASVTSNSTWVKSGNRVVLTAPAAKTGYTYNGWFDNNSGTGTAITTNANCTITVTSALTRYACYHENLTAITITTDGHGTITTPNPNNSPYSLGVATMQAINASPNTGYNWNRWEVSGNAALNSSATTQSNKAKGNGTNGGTGTITATFTPKQTTITLNNQDATTPGSTEVTATYDAAMPAITLPTKTGYTFGGYWGAPGGSGPQYYNADGSSTQNWDNENATYTLFAKWTAKTTTVSFSQSGEGYGSGGQVATKTATYDAAMPTPIFCPTAANGYAFMGYYGAAGGEGTKYYNADGTSANNWNQDATTATIYAYFKQAEITGITFSPSTVVENNSTVNVTAVISPEPTGITTVCWRILYDNGSALDPQPAFTPASRQGTEVSFIAPNASGMYKAEAVLHLGSGCGGSDISTYEANFQVAGSHNVTVAYKQGSTTIKASTIVTGRPLDWSDPITAPEIFGYTFDHWTAGDGITLSADGSTPVGSDESSANPIYITAIYNGTLTANYTPKNIIYFKDNLEWTDPDDADAHIYVNLLTDDYWNTDNGTGNKNVTNRNLQMDRVPGTTDIFYYEYGSKPTSKYISFTKESMNNYEHFYQSGTAHVVFPSRALDALGTDNKDGLGFYAATPMFVPLATQTPVKKNSNHATYYNDGYWTKYLPGTGYTLQIYNSAGNSLVKEVAFTSADELMPMKVVADLEGNHTYKFQLKRDGDVYYGNNGTMTYADHGQNTAWDFFNNSPFNMCTIVTTAAGDYTFNLSYSPNSGGTNNRLRISVDYPVSDGDYRLVYKDDVHTKMHPSAIVNKVNDGTDIVSFFVRKDENPELYIQQATVNPSTGAITWNEYPNSGTPTNQITGAIASAITTDTVYNFNLSMDGSGALTVASAEYYSGNYYIRTDAANSKWDNYRTDPDHLMTYSDYLKTDVGYSHYYTHWVRYTDTGRKNVKFVIANDYSPCISDTLAREEATGTWANIATFMEEGGDLKRSANVRFMWDIKTNAIARAYIDGAQEDGTHFLELLSADGKIKNTAETETLTAVTFSDNGNWIYEANIKAQPDAQIKLKSTWGEGTTIVQYFKGGADAEDTETLIGGSGENWYPIRVLYDFKTNRLVAAYVPTTGTYNTEDPINADVMFIREHQGDIAQLTFGGSGAISDIKTAYGVLRLNKWTINNKSKEAGHAPLVPELSRFERDLFYISFPFRVNLEEVFGFGTYGTHWIVEEYDGAGRAANGFWKDTPTFWRFITNRKGKFLEPNIGYIVALDLDELGETSSVWANTDQVELYFPSYGSMPDIKSSSVTHEVPAHTCTINRPTPKGDRRVADSHWNVMSVPTYINTNNVSFANTDWITTATETSVGPKFLYTVNWNDNSLTATDGVGYTYHAMHAYIVQYCGNVTWTTSVSPALAPRRNPDAPKDAEFCIELQQNEAMIDRTFVRLTDDEAVTSGFEFNYDMSKEFNKNKANIYTMVTTIMEDGPSVTETAGNCLPLTDQTTIVPMGVQIATTGDYTFSIPSGTNGVGVTLVDNETGIRTNLALMDYTIALEAGTQDDRFYLEISPIKYVATDIENTDAGDHVSNVRKMMVDGLLYIIKDGKVFDAHGARVK